VALALLLVRSLGQELVDALRALWRDDRAPPRTSLVPPALGSTASLSEARSFVHVARLKPGRFRRTALRFSLRLTHELGRTKEASTLGTALSLHGARFLLLDDGRLVSVSDHAERAALGLHAMVDRASTLLSLILSHTVRFPPTFGWFFGGARDQARFSAWVRAGEVRGGLEYGAYPELGVREIGDNAELGALLGSEAKATEAQRLLALLKD
jgi:hypothetical protein